MIFYLWSGFFAGAAGKGDMVQYSIHDTSANFRFEGGNKNWYYFVFNTSSKERLYPVGGQAFVGYQFHVYDNLFISGYLAGGYAYLDHDYMSSHFYGTVGVDLEVKGKNFSLFWGANAYLPYIQIKRYDVQYAFIKEGTKEQNEISKLAPKEDYPTSFENNEAASSFHIIPCLSMGFKIPVGADFTFVFRYNYLINEFTRTRPSEKYTKEHGEKLWTVNLEPEIKLGGHSILLGFEWHNIVGGA